ncbi:MAG: helix-turn-helix transcriptional regulator [Ruminococcus sp.]|nr:helix-turn-helix transcriptional regulator [Ruminococcus sp.]
MRTFNELKQQLLQNEDVKKEYERLEPEYQVMRAIIKARQEQNLTQQELADRTGIDRSDISKLENGSANPSLRTLKRLADGLGMQLQINFVHAN